MLIPMTFLIRFMMLLPPELRQALARRQHQYPLFRRLVRRLTTAAKRSEGTIQTGLGKGLRFDARCGPVSCLLGTIEPHVQWLLTELCAPGDRVYDVGANIGFFTCLLARHLSPSGQVVAFEPVLPNLHVLEHNVRLNRLTNVVAVQRAVSDRLGSLMMALEEHGVQHHVDVSDQSGRSSNTVSAPSITLDHYVYELNNLPPDLVKIDVEGHEESVLRGMKRLLADRAPLLLIEVHGTNRNISSLLETYGYWHIVVGEEGRPLTQAHWNAHALAGPPGRAAVRGQVLSRSPGTSAELLLESLSSGSKGMAHRYGTES